MNNAIPGERLSQPLDHDALWAIATEVTCDRWPYGFHDSSDSLEGILSHLTAMHSPIGIPSGTVAGFTRLSRKCEFELVMEEERKAWHFGLLTKAFEEPLVVQAVLNRFQGDLLPCVACVGRHIVTDHRRRGTHPVLPMLCDEAVQFVAKLAKRQGKVYTIVDERQRWRRGTRRTVWLLRCAVQL